MGDAFKAADVEYQLFEMSFGHYLGFFYTQGAVDACIKFLQRDFSQ